MCCKTVLSKPGSGSTAILLNSPAAFCGLLIFDNDETVPTSQRPKQGQLQTM